MKKFGMLLLVFSLLLLTACGGEPSDSKASNTDSMLTVEVNDNAPRYYLESQFSDWKAEFAVNYANVEHVQYLHGTHALSIVEVVNTGDNPINMFDLQEEYTVVDSEGVQHHASFEFSYPAIIYPGEAGYLFGYTSTMNTWDETTQLELVLNFNSNADVVLNHDEAKDYYRTFDVSSDELMVDENGNIHFMGKVTNNTDLNAEYVSVSVVLFDTQGRPLCIVSDLIDMLNAGETVEFDASATTAFAIETADVARWEMIAYDAK